MNGRMGPHQTEIADLLALSARLGREPRLVQASNGNTSIKLDGVLWIKASGKWLANAEREEMLVPVELAEVRDCLRHNRDIPHTHPAANGLRSSIETAMHAVLPQHVVVHVHCVNTIAWAVRRDAPESLAENLNGLRWQWIPYVPSGAPLAHEIEKALFYSPGTDVLVLGNHGLVVCGPDCDSTSALLREIARRLAIQPRAASEPDFAILAKLARFSGWCLPDLPELHALGTDAAARQILKGGILYPCEAIFLGPVIPMLPSSATLAEAAGISESGAHFLIVEGAGVLISEHITRAERAILLGLLHVVQRLDSPAHVRYLAEPEMTTVLTEDAHRYRELVEQR